MGDDTENARDGLHSVTRGTLILLLGTLGYVAANFVARVILVRNLSKGEFDEFYIALTLAGLLTALGQVGLPQAVARSIPYASSPEERRAIVRTGFLVTVPLAICAGAVLFGLSIPISQRYGSPLLGLTLEYFGIAVASSIVSSQVAAVFQGFEDVKPATINQILTPALFITFLVTLGGSGPWGVPLGYTGALIAYVLANVVSLGALVVYYRSRLPRILPAGPRLPEASRRLLLFAFPLFLVGVFSFLSGSVDTLLLGFYHNNEAGSYGAALSLARLLLVGLGALGYILLPVVTRLVRNRDQSSAKIVYGTATKWMILTSLPLFLVFFLYPGPSLGFVYKASYAQTTAPLQILLLGAFVSTLIGPASAVQISFGETQALLVNTVIAAAADGVIGLLLIPSMGIVGAAIAWTTASALLPILSIAELAWSYGLHPFLPHYLIPVLVTGIPAGVLLGLLPFIPSAWMLPVIVLLLAGTYLLVIILTRSIDRGDRLLLDAIERLLGRRLPGVRRVARYFPPRD